MKKSRIIVLLALFALSVILFMFMRSQKEIILRETVNVGDIVFDPALDNPNFYLCNEKNIPQYYSVSTSYQGGIKALKEYFFSTFQPVGTQSGYITIRFLVNCKGATDRFRISQIDQHYEKCTFDKRVVTQLLSSTKRLDKWIPGSYKGYPFDSYYYLTFKLLDGKLAGITP